MIKFIKDYFGTYYLLFAFSCLSIYFFPVLAPVISFLILLASYYLIAAKLRFDVVIALILYSRCINGFIIMHNETVFLVINLLTSIFPTILYFSLILGQKRPVISKTILIKYKYTLLFFVLLTVGFAYNFSTSYDLISKRYLPVAFFVLFLLAFTRKQDFNMQGMLQFFRSTFLASLIVYLFSDYLVITRELIESDTIFSVASSSNSFSLSYFSITRNMGPTFDHRIIGILAYLYLLLSIVFKSKYLKYDITLSFIVVVTTLSRGAILTYLLIFGAYLIQTGRKKFVSTALLTGLALFILLVLSINFLPERAAEYLESFSPFAKYNAINQREVFAYYAMNVFLEAPIFGNGVGFLTSKLIDRTIFVDGVYLTVAGDAFWYILLAEMGIVGFLLYILFLKEVFLSKNLLLIALFIGFIIQLLGTDIPDMRLFYFAILVLVFIAKDELTQAHKQEAALN